MSKHKQRHRPTVRNPNLDPNMLMILLVILGAYSRKPVYYFDNDLLNRKHKKTSSNEVDKEDDIGYTGGVLNEDNYTEEEAGSNSANDDISYTGGAHSKNDEVQDEISQNINDEGSSYMGEAFTNSDIPQEFESLNFKDEEDADDIVNTEVVPEYPNKLIIPDIGCDEIIAQVPVVLSQFELEFSCETIIKLDYPAQDIKRIKKNVFLGECKLLIKANKLFLGGIVRKNIEYGTEDNIRHATVEVPFKCTTKVEYFAPPVISSADEEIEIETLRSDGTGIDLSEITHISKENFSEKIYCKLVSDEIKELDILDEDKVENENPECERMFETLTEKMVIKLNLKLIQEQEINLNR